MKKVYITSLHFRHGGIEKIIVNLANALEEKGYEVEVLCTYNFGSPAYTLNPNVKITYLVPLLPNRTALRDAVKCGHYLTAVKEAYKGAKILYLKKSTMKRAIKSIREGTIISTRHENNLLMSKYGNPGVRKIAQLHVDHGFDKRLLSDFRRKYYGIDYFALLTDRSAKEIRSVMDGYNDRTKIISIPNFIEDQSASIISIRKKQVISVGRLHYDKNFESLLRIWALLAPKHPDWRLKIIGEGELEVSLRAMAVDLGIKESVIFTGALPHEKVMEELAMSSCYAMTSHYESFGIALAEAMSCGTPPVAFNVRVGPEYIISDGTDGFLIPEKDEAAFADKLELLLENEEKLRIMSDNSFKKAARFSKTAVISKWMEILL